MTGGKHMKLLTRQEIINEWSKQPEHILNCKCCPVCRDILDEYPDRYFCLNDECPQGYILKSEVVE